MSSPVQPDPATGVLRLREACGLDHERQVIAVAVPARGDAFALRDEKTGREFPAQASRENPGTALVQLELRAGDDFRLVAQDSACAVADPVQLVNESGRAIVSNGKWAAEIFLGEWRAEAGPAPTPIRRVRVGQGAWRGSFFFETRRPVQHVRSEVIEIGPLRIVVRYEAKIGSAQSYSARLTFDAGADFIAIDEQFHGEAGDQIVWDFAGPDLPEQIHLLDSTAGFTTQPLHYFFDRRLARLACWNQYSQLHDFSDGYALQFADSEDVLGLVALRGGDWDGNAHNFLEAWTRRWLPGDPSSRRLVPPEAKADAAPSPERIAARPANECEAHFSLEGWLHRGRRIFALVLTSAPALRSLQWNAAPPLGHFEEKPDRARYRQQQSLLRRIHTQRGLFSLEDQLAMTWAWPEEKVPAHLEENPPWQPRDPLSFVPPKDYSIEERREQIWDFLSARVFGFWEGSGAAYTNAVVNRRLAEDLLAWEWLAAKTHLDPEQRSLGRARFVFLCHLLTSDHYYPGPALMGLGAQTKSMEPAIAGMANQNFFTDVYNFPGIAAQVFHEHPEAAQWRERFTCMWRRQLEYHTYAESGVWEESHTYFHHVLQTLLPTFVRRRDDGIEDAFADAKFQHVVASLLKMLTPRDACYGGKRHVVALGDHGVDLNDLYRPLYRLLAQYIAPFNPELSAHLAWAYREMDGDEPLAVQPQAMPWRHEYVQGLGYFFRDRDERGGESLMVLRCGSAWAHHHNDEGSLHYFYAGRAWIVDSAFSYPQETAIRKFRADGHSRWTTRDFDPLNYLWQFNRGWITRHGGEGAFPYAIAHTPIYMAESSAQQYIPLRRPILHRRAVVQLAPSAYLVLDYSDQNLPQVTRFHIPCDAPFALEDAASPSNMHGPVLRLCSLFGLHAPQKAATDRPTQAGENYATREIKYAWKEQPLTALLILIETENTPGKPSVREEGSAITLEHAEFAVTLDIRDPKNVGLRDLKTGSALALPIGESTPQI